MPTELEKYLKSNRNTLDVESPEDIRIWCNIEKILHKNGSIQYRKRSVKLSLIRIRNIAAAAVILFSIGYIGNDLFQNSVYSRRVSLNTVDEIAGDREQDYKTLVKYKEQEIKTFDIPQSELISELFNEIKNLDIIYGQAMKDLKELGKNDQVINTIFDTYERKIQLLELIIIETNKIRNEKDYETTL